MAKPRVHDATQGAVRRRLLRPLRAAVLVALLLGAALPGAIADSGSRDGAQPDAPTYEERAKAEKTSRSRYRRLEVASAILIIAAGSAAILWVIRRR